MKYPFPLSLAFARQLSQGESLRIAKVLQVLAVSLNWLPLWGSWQSRRL